MLPTLMLALLAPASLLAAGPALAQSAQKAIQIIVPFAPGASADGAARIVANELGPRLGRQVVVEHRAGAGGALGLQMLAKSAPDGDTLGVGATGAPLLNSNLPSNPGPDVLRDLAPVAKLIDVAIVLVAHPSTGPKSILDMIERSKTTPGGLTYGSTGTNTSQHLSIELFKRATGANLVHVPYRGSAPAVVDLIAGQIPLASVDLTSAYPHIQTGRLTALGLIDGKRFAAAPEVPTIAESGVPGFARASGFIGLFAPAGTPTPIVKKLSQEVAAILATPSAQATARTLTSAIAYEDDATFARFLASESVKWKQALSSLDLRQ
jgi:tripartite-type tricarboxylate transporter receptor subunit TctC